MPDLCILIAMVLVLTFYTEPKLFFTYLYMKRWFKQWFCFICWLFQMMINRWILNVTWFASRRDRMHIEICIHHLLLENNGILGLIPKTWNISLHLEYIVNIYSNWGCFWNNELELRQCRATFGFWIEIHYVKAASLRRG